MVPCVVSYRNSTSNHNTPAAVLGSSGLYLIEILHQTTTPSLLPLPSRSCILSKFYIKPQRQGLQCCTRFGCILSKFYIKPQPSVLPVVPDIVVSYRNSTSNHNWAGCQLAQFGVVSYRNSTSNHNGGKHRCNRLTVVSYRNSTSNHNWGANSQTTCLVVSYRNSTSNHNSGDEAMERGTVVSYRNSTSNHNIHPGG